MKTLKIIGISLLQSLLFTLLSYTITRTFISFSNIVLDETTAIGIIGGADGPTAIFLATKILGGSIFVLSFIVLSIIASICNISALIPNIIASRSIFFLCNLLAILYCYLFLNYTKMIFLLMVLIVIAILTMGYIVVRGNSEL